MPDVPGSVKDISALYEERRKDRGEHIAAMNEVAQAINGIFPKSYKQMFSDTDVMIQLQTTRSAYDTLRRNLAEIPVLPHVDTLGKRTSDAARNKAELVEKVMHSYHHGSAMRGTNNFQTTLSLLADYQVAFYDAALEVNHDIERKLIYFRAVNPMHLFPPVGHKPWTATPLDGVLIVYEMTLGEVKRRWAHDSRGNVIPDVMGRLNASYKAKWGHGGKVEVDDTQTIQVGAYRSRAKWMIVALGDSDVALVESEPGDKDRKGRPSHPGVCGVVSFEQHGKPLLTGQIGIEAALMKVMNQQIQNTERINRAPIVGPPLIGDTLRWGEYNVIDMTQLNGQRFQPQRMAPDSPANLNQVMGSLVALADKFNYNPESAQGAGPAVSGKAISQLQAGPRSQVTGVLFSPYKSAFPRAYDAGMEMELNLWPNEKKTVRGKKGRQSFEVEYTPTVALAEYIGHVEIEDAQIGGYNAFLEAVQKRDAGLGSRRSAMEKDPDIRDVEEELRRVELEESEKFVQAGAEGLGGQDPLMAIRIGSELIRRISKGEHRTEAIQAMMEEGFFDPPAPDPMAAGGMPPGMPPELAGLMGGEMPALPAAPPSLADIRG